MGYRVDSLYSSIIVISIMNAIKYMEVEVTSWVSCSCVVVKYPLSTSFT